MAGGDGLADGRGVAIADFDGDGRQDVVVANNHAPPDLYLNRSRGGDSLSVDLRGTSSSRDPIGARLRLTVRGPQGERVLTRWLEAGSGYASQSSMRVHFGLGLDAAPTQLEVLWPSGRQTTLRTSADQRHLEIVEPAQREASSHG